MTADTSMHAVDILNQIGNNFAISSDGIATALQDSASSLVAANNSYEQAVALIAAANRVVQDPNSVGAALRTISLRLRGTSAKELEEVGEDTDGAIESKSKLRGKIKGYTGIDILTDSGAYKSTYEILLEISKVWDNLTDMNRAGLLELIAGKTRSNTAAAILSNTKDLEKAYEQALAAEGSALQENEKYLDSIQGRIDLFNNAVQTMWNNTLDSDVVKQIVDIGTGLIKIVDKLGLVRTLLFGIFSYISIFKKQGGLDFAEVLGLQNKQGKSIIGKEGFTGWLKNKYQARKSNQSNVNTFANIESLGDQEYEQLSIFDDDIQTQTAINEKKSQLKALKDDLRKLRNNTKFDDIDIPQDALEFKTRNSRKHYLNEVLIPNKEKEIAAIEQDIDDIVKAGRVKVEQARIKLVETDNDQMSFDFDAMFGKATEVPTQQYQSMLDAVSKFNNIELKMPNMNEVELANVMDIINAKTTAGQGALLQYFSTLDNGNEALQAYIASLNGGTASLTGFNNFIQAHNAGLKASSVATKMAAVRHAALNAAISMGLSILIQFVIEGLGKLIEYLKGVMNPAEKLKEELSDLSSELSSIESEIDSLNTELDKCKDRMTELLALPSLSFTDKEELNNLRLQTAELERQIELQNTLLDSKKTTQASTAKELIDAAWNDQGEWYIDSKGVIHEDSGWKGFWNNSEKTTDVLNEAFVKYEPLANSNKIYEKAKKELEQNGEISADTFADMLLGNSYFNVYKTKEQVEQFRQNPHRNTDEQLLDAFYTNVVQDSSTKNDVAEGISKVLSAQSDFIKKNNLSYGISKDIDKYLDEIYTYSLKFKSLQGQYIKSDAISSLFDASSTEELQSLGRKLQDIVGKDTDENGKAITDQEKREAILKEIDAINDEADAYNRLNLAMDIAGVTAKDIADYFILETGTFNSDTIEGITAQYAKGVEVLKQFRTAQNTLDEPEISYTDYDNEGNEIQKTIRWDELFDKNDAGEFTANMQRVAEVLNGTDESVRNNFAHLVEGVKNGSISMTAAINSFAASGMVAACRLIESEISELNTDVFKDLGDELSGVIDTFHEFSSALESVAGSMELLDAAQTQMAHSGRISVKTALELMQSTDNWNQLLEIEDGNIRLVDDATEILIQSKLDLIKKNLQAALATVEAQLAEISATESSADMAYTIEESTNLAVQQLAGNMAYLTTIMEAYAKQDAGENINISEWIGKADDARKNVLAQTDYKKNAAERIGVEELEQKKEELEAMLEMYKGIDDTSDFKKNHDYTKTPGDKYDKDSDGVDDDKEDAISDEWEKLLKRYENRLALITNQRDLIQAEIDQMEATGAKASWQYYKDLIENSNAERDLLVKKHKSLKKYLELNKHLIDQDTWTEMNNEINETAVAIQECTVNLLEYYDAMEEIDAHYFEQTTDDISRLGEEIQFVQGLLENDKVADENGNWTNEGITQLGLYVNEMERAAASADLYKRELSDVEASWVAYQNLLKEAGEGAQFEDIDSDKLTELYNKYGYVITSAEEYKEKTDELTDSMYSEIEAYESAKDGIVELNEARVDAIKEGIDKEIEAYEELIDLKKEELSAERELYEFRDDIKKQTKDIASLERKIAALSGADDAASVAERRKLEAQLLESKESLNNSYYGHAKDQQSQALDDEMTAFQDSKDKYIEELEKTLENTEELITNSMMDVLLNADVVHSQLNDIAEKYGITLSQELTQPWANASEQARLWKEKVGAYTGECTPFVVALSDSIKQQLGNGKDNAWSKATNAVQNYVDFLTGKELKDNFSATITGFGTQISGLVTHWNNVKTAANNAYTAIQRASTVGGNPITTETPKTQPTEPTKPTNSQPESTKTPKYKATGSVNANGTSISVTTTSFPTEDRAKSKAETMLSKAVVDKMSKHMSVDEANSKWDKIWSKKASYTVKQYAKGTMGTTKDAWSITDEPWLGDELVLVPTASGNLSYMRKGTSVVPAAITENLVEWGKLNPNALNLHGSGVNVNMISNAVNKPEIKLSFDALVKAERIDENTLPDVKRFVQQEMNNLMKQMNYAIKVRGAR